MDKNPVHHDAAALKREQGISGCRGHSATTLDDVGDPARDSHETDAHTDAVARVTAEAITAIGVASRHGCSPGSQEEAVARRSRSILDGPPTAADEKRYHLRRACHRFLMEAPEPPKLTVPVTARAPPSMHCLARLTWTSAPPER